MFPSIKPYSFILLFQVISLNLFGQLNIIGGNTAQKLVEDFFIGQGVEVSNVVLGAQTQIGQVAAFTNMNSNLSLSEGILLSTGLANEASITGTNINPSYTSHAPNCPSSYGLCLNGDSDLEAIVGDSTFDAAVLEFDFIPLSDTIRFRYVFASEEYSEYNCSNFNDAFAFILSGPGFPAQNIAMIPNTTVPVAINTVNNGFVGINGAIANCVPPNGSLAYSNYYIDNIGGQFVQYDGMTKAMEVTAVVTPCATYHIKLAIADATDGTYDSGVFLEANSFTTNALLVDVVTENNDSVIVEGCNDAKISIHLPNVTNTDYTINYTVFGEAINGTDIQFLNSATTIPSGQDSTVITITPIDDGVVEGLEKLYIVIPSSICRADTVLLYVKEETILPAPMLYCDTANAVSVTIHWDTVTNADGYLVNYNGTNWNMVSKNTFDYTVYGLLPNTIQNISVQAVGGFSVCTPHPITTISCSTLPCFINGNVTNISNTSCFGIADGEASIQMTGGQAPYTYSLDGMIAQSSNTFMGLSAGAHTVQVYDRDSCSASFNFTIGQPAPVQIVIDSILPTQCPNSADGSISISTINHVGNTQFTLENTTNTTGFFDQLAADTFNISVIDSNGCKDTIDIEIPSPEAFQFANTIISPSCNGFSDGAITTNVTGGTPDMINGYSYQWQPLGQTNQTITNIASGLYHLTITDGNNCTDTTSVFLSEPNILKIDSVTTKEVSCYGGNDGSIEVFVSGGILNYTYQWSNMDTTAVTTGLSAGTYQIIVTDANGCNVSQWITITSPPALQIQQLISTNVSCYGGNNGTATIVVNEPGVSYLWLPSLQTTASAVNLQAGKHIIEVTNIDGCITVDSVVLTEPSPLIATITEIQGASCYQGNDGKAKVNVSGGMPSWNTYTYQWSTTPTQFTETAIALVGGVNYTVTVTDSLGCQNSTDITISQPSAIRPNGSSVAVNCYGGNDGQAIVNPIGGTPPYRYQWDAQTGGQTNRIATNLKKGIYNVVVTDSLGCKKMINIGVAEPKQLELNLEGINVKCKGESTGKVFTNVQNGVPPYSFLWNTNSKTSSIQGLKIGNYGVTVTDSKGCFLSDSLNITEPTSKISASFTVVNATCFGDRDGSIKAMSVGGKLPHQYSIDGVNFTNTNYIIGLFADDYNVFVRDDNGCLLDTFIVVEEPKPMRVFAGTDITISFGETATLLASVVDGVLPLTYEWLPDEKLSCSDCPKTLATPIFDAFYDVIVTDANGCVAMDDIAVRVVTPHNIYVASAFSPNNDGINDYLFVQGEATKIQEVVSFQIYDRWGELVFQTAGINANVATLGWNGIFKNKLMPSGVFFWKTLVRFTDGYEGYYEGEAILVR